MSVSLGVGQIDIPKERNKRSLENNFPHSQQIEDNTPSSKSNGYMSSNQNYQLGSSLFDSSSQSIRFSSDALSSNRMNHRVEEYKNGVIIEEEDSELDSIKSNEAHVGDY